MLSTGFEGVFSAIWVVVDLWWVVGDLGYRRLEFSAIWLSVICGGLSATGAMSLDVDFGF